MKTQAHRIKEKCLIPLKLLIILFIPLSSYAHPIVQGFENRTDSVLGLILEPRVSLYSTETNFDQSSTPVALSGNKSVSQTYFDLNAAYRFHPKWFALARASYQKQWADQLLGLGYRAIEDDTTLTIQLDLTLPFSNNPQISDGSVDAYLGAFYEAPIFKRTFSIELGGAYLFRSRSYSSATPFSAFLKYAPNKKGLFAGFGLRGQVSLETDPNLFLNSGTSALFNGINSSWLVTQAKVGYRFSKANEIFTLVAAPISGTRAPSGIQVSIGMRFHFENEAIDQAERPQAARANKLESETQYDFESSVTSVNDQLYLLKIEHGAGAGVLKGQVFDIFAIEADPSTQRNSEIRVARASVTHVKKDEAALNVLEYYRDQWIEQGFTAKRVR